MPKWIGMLIHYVTFKKIFTSKEGWIFYWKRDGLWEMVSPFPMSCPRYQVHPDGSRTQIEDYVPRRWGGRLWLADE